MTRDAAPLLAGIAAAWVLLWAFAPPEYGYPVGTDWGQYLSAAEYLWLPRPDTQFPAWRRPLFPWLVGAIGTGVGYVAAAQALSTLSAAVLVAAAGLIAAILAGPRVGGLAAVAATFVLTVTAAMTWVSPYPSLAAAAAVALAAAVVAAERASLVAAIVAGAAAGVAWAIDDRGLATVGLVGALVAVGPWPTWRARAGAAVAAAGVGAGGFAAIVAAIDPGTAHLPLGAQIRTQTAIRTAFLRYDGADPALVQLCRAPGPAQPWDACGRALVAWNLGELLKVRAIPPPWVAPLALAALIPGRSWRDSAVAAMLLAGSWGALLAGAGLVAYGDRYALPFVAPIAALTLVGGARVGERLLGWRIDRALAGAIGAAVVLLAWAPARFAALPPALMPPEAQVAEIDRWLATLPDGAPVIDCTGLHVQLALLPDPPTGLRSIDPGHPECAAAARAASDGWLLTQDAPPLIGRPRRAPGLDVAELERQGWRAERSFTAAPEAVRVWRRGP